MIATPYLAPLDRLLTLGDASKMKPWPDYTALGLGPEHVTDLIRMATDPDLNDASSDSAEVWAPAHAWRTLAQVRAVEAAAPLARLFQRIDEVQDDFVAEDLPEAFGVMGPGAIPALAAYLADETIGLLGRRAAGESLEQIGTRHAEAREAAVAVLAGQLGLAARQDPGLNGSLIAYLIELKAVDAAEVIELAFRAGQVDELLAGDWEAVQVALDLKPPRPAPTPQAVVQSRLEQALREAQLDGAPGPKRKHHRKRK